MADAETIGDYIRDRRLALGFSAGQLAMRLGSTAAVVRSWERGTEPVPRDALQGLADLLNVEVSELGRLDGLATDVVAPEPEEAAADEKPAAVEEPVAGPEPEPEAEAAEPEAADIAEEADEPESDEPESDEQEPAEDDTPDDHTGEPLAAVGHPPRLDLDDRLLDAPTEAIEPVPASVATATRPRPEPRSKSVAEIVWPPVSGPEPAAMEPTATTVDGSIPDWLGPFKVLLDPDNRYIYWIRAILTFIGLVILLRVIGYALGGLVEALGDFLDGFRSIEPAEEEFVRSLISPRGF